MTNNNFLYTGKGQASRLSSQHEESGGPLGIFGIEAKKHDLKIGEVTNIVLDALKNKYPNLQFRKRNSISKKEINNKLSHFDERFGKVLFLKNASIKPDGGIVEVKDDNNNWRIILVGESKHQGNDVEKIKAGIKQGKNKDSDFMAAGNAIERVHKNILEFRNLMIDEDHFPYVVFFQGSNFATKSFFVKSPDGREVKVEHDSGILNRIDRVTASSYASEINKNYCKNTLVRINERERMIQIPSLYFQSETWGTEDMYLILFDIAISSIKILKEQSVLKRIS